MSQIDSYLPFWIFQWISQEIKFIKPHQISQVGLLYFYFETIKMELVNQAISQIGINWNC